MQDLIMSVSRISCDLKGASNKRKEQWACVREMKAGQCLSSRSEPFHLCVAHHIFVLFDGIVLCISLSEIYMERGRKETQ